MTLATVKKIVPLEPNAIEPLHAGLQARAEVALDTVVFTVAVEDYRALCERLYRAGFDFPSCLSGTDMDWGLGVALHLQSLETKHKVAVRTYVPYNHPLVPSVTDLWGGVEWHEREAYDLVGIHFTGHPDLRRLLTEDHWTIHPLQRKYNTRGYEIPEWSAKPWPAPAPWEEGFTPFAGAAPAAAAHAAPAKTEAAKPAAPAAAKPAPKTEAPAESASSAPAAAATPATPSATASSETAASGTVPLGDAAKPAQTKERKRWEPKGGAAPATSSDAAPAVSSAPAAAATPSSAPEAQHIASQPVSSKPASTDQDDLKRIEGIGPKINEALVGAGITTFMQLAAMSEDQLRGFLETAGLPFAPSVTTWAEQAGFLARGDEAGFKALTDRLTSGRAESASPSAATEASSSVPAASEDKPKNPKIKRWEPKG